MQTVLYGARKEKKLSQQEMADKLGISRVSYGAKERGDKAFTLDEMFRISKILGKGLDDIFLPRGNQNGYKTKSKEEVK